MLEGRKVIVRTFSAGVHFGELMQRSGKEVLLTNARRIWNWTGANTLHEISLRGVTKGSRVSDPVRCILLTEAIEILVCEETAIVNLEKVGWSK